MISGRILILKLFSNQVIDMSKTNVGLTAMYNGGLSNGLTMSGGRRRRPMKGRGFMDWIKKAHSFVKDNQLISKARKAADAVGITDAIDSKTGGYFSKATDLAASKGYGRRRRRVRKTTKRKSGSKTSKRRR